jgi:hypothetical protein
LRASEPAGEILSEVEGPQVALPLGENWRRERDSNGWWVLKTRNLLILQVRNVRYVRLVPGC